MEWHRGFKKIFDFERVFFTAYIPLYFLPSGRSQTSSWIQSQKTGFEIPTADTGKMRSMCAILWSPTWRNFLKGKKPTSKEQISFSMGRIDFRIYKSFSDFFHPITIDFARLFGSRRYRYPGINLWLCGELIEILRPFHSNRNFLQRTKRSEKIWAFHYCYRREKRKSLFRKSPKWKRSIPFWWIWFSNLGGNLESEKAYTYWHLPVTASKIFTRYEHFAYPSDLWSHGGGSWAAVIHFG